MANDAMTQWRAGQMLGSRFRLIRRLGAGGLSEVWLAEDSRGGGQLAVKKLAPEWSQDPSRAALFRKEFAIAESLVHPAILRPQEFFSAGGSCFFTMPVMPGGHVGERRGAPWAEIAHLAVPVCGALAYAHRKGVVHGDVKPENVLLDKAGAPRLTDFGAARVPDAGRERRVRRPGGSLPYMSPQQLEGAPAEISDDIYALGCVLYELLCGFPPYAPDISEESTRGGQFAPPAAADGAPPIPETLVALVSAMLASDKKLRPVTVQAVRAALAEILEESSAGGGSAQAAAIVARARATGPEGGPAAALQRRPGVPMWAAYALGGLLLAVAVSLFFALPRFAEERAARLPPAPPLAQETEAAQEDRQLLRAQRDAADEAMGGMLQDRNYLAALRPDIWSDGVWERAMGEERKGDELYRQRDYPEAQVAYRQTGGMLRELRAQAPDIGRKALQEAQASIESGNQPAALAALEKAGILLGETDPAVQLAGRRASKLPEIMQAVEKARAARRDASLREQRAAWQAVLKADPERQSARQALAAVNATLDQQLFGSRMSRGHAALGEGDLAGARAAFEAAGKQRPNDAAPAAALEALELEERGQRLAELQAGAMAGKFREDWKEAAAQYQRMLEIDANIVAAQQGLAQAQRRARLDDALEGAIANAQKLNRDGVWQQARRLLDEATSLANPGPRLSGQTARLEHALTVAATPAPVRLRSDGLTQVSIYYVGRLGSFADRVVQLRPGAYTAVGIRDGYRDVRREFVVAPEGLADPLVLICTEPI